MANPQQPPAEPIMEAGVYDAYQAALDILNEQCESTSDKEAVRILNDAAQALSDMLTKDNMVHLEANAAQFTTLTPQMKKSNEALKKLKDQLAWIAAKIADVGKVMGAVNDVLALTAHFV